MEQFSKSDDSVVDLSEPKFALNQNNSLILSKKPLSNQGMV
jgi:hypothetical protein